MNRNVIIGAVVVVLLALGAWFVFSQGNTATNTENNQEETGENTSGNNTSTSGSPTRGSGSLSQVFTQGGNYTCTLNATRDGLTTTGTVYATGNKTRVDFRVQLPDTTAIQTHIIRDGSFSYTWTDGQTTGVKSRITSSGAVDEQPQGAGSMADVDGTYDWECRPWIPQTSQFVPPTEITFTQS